MHRGDDDGYEVVEGEEVGVVPLLREKHRKICIFFWHFKKRQHYKKHTPL